MPVIRSKPTVFSYCQGLFLCCSPEAARILGIGGALILNNLMCCAQEPNIGKLMDENKDIYYSLESALAMNDLSELIDPIVIETLVENMRQEEFIKVKKIANELYYRILYD